MRTALAAALLALALPALAQDAPAPADAALVVEIDTTDDGPRVVVRRWGGGDGVRTFRFDVPDLERLAPLRDGPLALFESGEALRLLRGISGQPDVSPETRERMRDLEAEAHALARQARDGDDGARDRLDAVLSDLFDVRAEARRERADALRDRAAELEDEAAEIEAALREREARRRALIEARRAELLGEPAGDW